MQVRDDYVHKLEAEVERLRAGLSAEEIEAVRTIRRVWRERGWGVGLPYCMERLPARLYHAIAAIGLAGRQGGES